MVSPRPDTRDGPLERRSDQTWFIGREVSRSGRRGESVGRGGRVATEGVNTAGGAWSIGGIGVGGGLDGVLVLRGILGLVG